MQQVVDSEAAVLRTTAPEVAQDLLGSRFARHELKVLGQGHNVDFSLRQERLYNVGFHLVSYGHDVEVTTVGWRDFYLLQLTFSGVCELSLDGTGRLALPPGSVHVINPGTAYRKRWSSDARQLIVRIPRHAVERVAAAESGPVLFAAGGDSVATDVVPLLKFLWADVTAERPAPRSPMIDHIAIQHLVTVLLHSIPNSVIQPRDDDAPLYLIRADGYMRRHFAEDIGVEDIARACGVSSRALQDAFRRHWRTTPTAHLRGLRLEVAHRMLTERPFNVNVTEVAHAIGITNLGRFSHYYWARFGEHPSLTLQQSKDTIGGH